MRQTGDLRMAILDDGGLAPNAQQLDVHPGSTAGEYGNDAGTRRLCTPVPSGPVVAEEDDCRPGPRIRLDVVVVSMQYPATERNVGSPQREPMLLSCDTRSHRQAGS